MRLFNSIDEYRRRKTQDRFYANPGLVVSNKGEYHGGLRAVLKEMALVCDYRVLAIKNADLDQQSINLLIERLHPYNLDAVILLSDLAEQLSFSLQPTDSFLRIQKPAFYLQVFNIFKPKHFFIGQKDFFEAKSISELILDFDYDIKLHVIPHARNKEGVLMSSNLLFLPKTYLVDINVLHRSLEFLQRMITNGQRDVVQLEKLIQEYVGSFQNFVLDELLILDALTLKRVNYIESDKQIFIQISGNVSQLKFVDNCIL